MKIRKIYERGSEGVWNLLYPHRCPICHRILRDQRTLVCPECYSALTPIQEPFCRKCGIPVQEEEEYCKTCRTADHAFTEGRGLYLYTQSLRKSIILYKFGGRREYAAFFSLLMSRNARREILRWKPDLIIPIPLHKSKLRKRGFNQSELLAVRISRDYNIPLSTTTLTKPRETRSQKRLDRASRRKNLKKAFHVTHPVPGLKILLIDDVYTTGSTINAAADTLLTAGASQVYFLTLCIAR